MSQSVQPNPQTELAVFHLTRDSMEVSEFDLFCLAHTAWYGEKPARCYLEQQFDNYLLSGVLPFYVRHYCREFVAAHPETVNNACLQEKRSRFLQRLVMGLIIGFVAGALILS